MNHGSTRSRWKSLLGLACATVLSLVACGGGGGDSAAPSGKEMLSQAGRNPGTTVYRLTRIPGLSENAFAGRVGLNEAGQVAGRDGARLFFFDGATTHYFVPPEPAGTNDWDLRLSDPVVLNERGQVAGTYSYENPSDFRDIVTQSFLWSREGGFVIVPAGNPSSANDLNDAGQVIGISATNEGYLWSQRDGLRTDFGSDTQLQFPERINNSGQIGGYGRYRGVFGALLVDTERDMTYLVREALSNTSIRHLNDAGDVAGFADNSSSGLSDSFFLNPTTGFGPIDLGALVDDDVAWGVSALNERGDVAFWVTRPPADLNSLAYFWSKDSGTVVEMVPPDRTSTYISDLNDQGLAVGAYNIRSGTEFVRNSAFAWTRESGFVDLNTRVRNPPAGLELGWALAVNDEGVILVSSNIGLVLLTPVTSAPAEEPPVVGPIVAPDTGKAGERISFSAEFTDADASDTHTATWSWGDGSKPQAGTVTGSAGSGRVTGAHVFRKAGVYTVSLRVTDSGGRSVEVSREIVITGSSVGFVKGNGWFPSPSGALKSDPTATGQAHFNFLVQYKQAGKSRKEHSKASFMFRTEQIRFRSESLDSLVIDGSQAQLEGHGSLDGQEGYRFVVSALDASNGEGDRVRVRIWRPDSKGGKVIVYDNGAEPDYRGSPLGGGNIVVRYR